MKKEIMELLKSKDGEMRLNNISKLVRVTKNALNDDVDILLIEFDAINKVNFTHFYASKIESRDYEGIIRECKSHTELFLTGVKERLLLDLEAGYRNSR